MLHKRKPGSYAESVDSFTDEDKRLAQTSFGRSYGTPTSQHTPGSATTFSQRQFNAYSPSGRGYLHTDPPAPRIEYNENTVLSADSKLSRSDTSSRKKLPLIPHEGIKPRKAWTNDAPSEPSPASRIKKQIDSNYSQLSSHYAGPQETSYKGYDPVRKYTGPSALVPPSDHHSSSGKSSDVYSDQNGARYRPSSKKRNNEEFYPSDPNFRNSKYNAFDDDDADFIRVENDKVVVGHSPGYNAHSDYGPPAYGHNEYDVDDYQPTKPKQYQPPPYVPSYQSSEPPKSSELGTFKMVLLGIGALLALYVSSKAISWWRGSHAFGRISCGSYEFAACREQGCSYDPDKKSCFLPSPSQVVQEAGFKAPYRFLFLGHPSADTTTCVNSLIKGYGSGSYLSSYTDWRAYQKTSMDQVQLYDTPGMDLTTDLDAFYKVRKFVGGVELGQNLTRHPFSWVNDKANAASRVVLVLDMRDAVKGWLWHSVKHSGIAYFTSQLEKVDTALPIAPLVILNTKGYKAKTANKVRDALRQAYRLDSTHVFNVDCSYASPLEVSKILYAAFLENKYGALRLDNLII